MDFKTELFSKLYDAGYRYIARDDDGTLYAYVNEPNLDECGNWECAGYGFYGLKPFSKVFDSITSEATEPFYIGKHLGIMDWDKVPVDTKVLVRDYDEED